LHSRDHPSQSHSPSRGGQDPYLQSNRSAGGFQTYVSRESGESYGAPSLGTFNPGGIGQEGFVGQDERGIAYYDIPEGMAQAQGSQPMMFQSQSQTGLTSGLTSGLSHQEREFLRTGQSMKSTQSLGSLSHTSKRPMTTSKVAHNDALMNGQAIYAMDEDTQQAVAETIKMKMAEHNVNLTDMFLALDKDRSGQITAKELQASLAQMQVHMSMTEIASLMMSFDEDFNGRISYSEFLQWMRQWGEEQTGLQWDQQKVDPRPDTAAIDAVQRKAAQAFEEDRIERLKTAKADTTYEQLIKKIAEAISEQQLKLRKIFNKHDKNKNGSLNKEEFRSAMQDLGYNFSQEQIDAMYQHFDVDGNGKVNFWEFVRALGTEDDEQAPMTPSRPKSARHREAIDSASRLREQELLRELLEPVSESLSDEDIVRKIAQKVEQSGVPIPSLWKSFPTNSRKHLTSDLFSEAMQRLGLNVSPALAQRLLNSYDLDMDGEMSLSEFSRMLSSVQTDGQSSQQPDQAPDEQLPDSLSDHQIFQACVRKSREAGMSLPDFVKACDEAGGGKGVNGHGLQKGLKAVGADLSFDRAKGVCEDYSMDGSGAIPPKQFLQLLQAEAAKMTDAPASSPAPKVQVQVPPPRNLQTEKELIPSNATDEEIFRKILEKMGEKGVSIPQMLEFVDEEKSGNMNGWGLKKGMEKLGCEIDLQRAMDLVKDYSLASDGSFMPTKAFGQLLQAQAQKFRLQTPGAPPSANTTGLLQRENSVDPEEERRLVQRAHQQLEEEESMSAAKLRRRYMEESELIKSLREDLFAQNRHMKSMFQRMDRSDDGSINYKDFILAMEKIGIPISDVDAMRILQRFDRTGDGRLDYNEFMRLLQNASDILVHDTGVRSTVDLGRKGNSGMTWGAEGMSTGIFSI